MALRASSSAGIWHIQLRPSRKPGWKPQEKSLGSQQGRLVFICFFWSSFEGRR